ncbi:hypothetical protein PV327_011277 [Microctonus hyperodae]|uniref:Uncharacterized protein n=1 Tax=Microctonus hyperodae TaxID=165561 RepID=A0AA39C3K3_MICHY|nr:hypothetical protein PV327_011277 [Microctonus hyperodae]
MSDRGSDNEEEPQGRGYVWRLTKPELEEELQRNHVPFEPNTTVLNMKRMLSNFLKSQSGRASQASDNEEEEEVRAPLEVNINVQNRREDEIRSAPTSRPVTPVRPDTPAVTLEAVGLELLRFREQMADDFQAQLALIERRE